MKMNQFHFSDNREVLRVHEESELRYLSFAALDELGFVKHLFTTRYGGVSEGMFESLNLSYSRGDVKEKVDENYRRVAREMNCELSDIVCSDQTHTTNIRVVTAADKGKGITRERDYTDIDGLVTNEPGIVLACFFADCVPIYLVDPVHEAIGLCHSGWRGTLNRISAHALQVMSEQYGTNPADVYACVGPSICGKCYEIGWDVAQEFAQLPFADEILTRKPQTEQTKPEQTKPEQPKPEQPKPEQTKPEQNLPQPEQKYLLDLWKTNELVLREAGVAAERIAVTNLCTCCNGDSLFSHRASHGKRGNLGAFLKIGRKN